MQLHAEAMTLSPIRRNHSPLVYVYLEVYMQYTVYHGTILSFFLLPCSKSFLNLLPFTSFFFLFSSKYRAFYISAVHSHNNTRFTQSGPRRDGFRLISLDARATRCARDESFFFFLTYNFLCAKIFNWIFARSRVTPDWIYWRVALVGMR